MKKWPWMIAFTLVGAALIIELISLVMCILNPENGNPWLVAVWTVTVCLSGASLVYSYDTAKIIAGLKR